MNFKTTLVYKTNVYHIEFSAEGTNGVPLYHVRIGSSSSLAITNIKITPTAEPGIRKTIWLEDPLLSNERWMDPIFVQSVGEAIEAHKL